MRCEDLTPRLVDHLSGTLPDAQRDGFDRHLQSCQACRAELDALSDVWRKLGDVPTPRADSRRMRDRFDALLAAESAHAEAAPLRPIDARHAEAAPPRSVDARHAQAAPPRSVDARHTEVVPSLEAGARSRQPRGFDMRPLLQIAAAIGLLAVGYEAGRHLSANPSAATPDVTELRQEVRDLRQMVALSLLQQQSASERLKGVSWSRGLDGNEVVAALIETLTSDANVNVRLASIDALKRFAEREAVRAAAIRALDTQTSPLVQMALIDFVVETRDRAALDALRRLAANERANDSVREHAMWGMESLEAA